MLTPILHARVLPERVLPPDPSPGWPREIPLKLLLISLCLGFVPTAGWAAEAAERSGMHLVTGKLNVELIAPLGADKGSAALELADGFAAALYAGDDLGDLRAFEALREWPGDSLCVAVGGAETPGELLAGADAIVAGPEGALELLVVVAALS